MSWILILAGVLLLIGTFVKPSDMRTEADAVWQSGFLLRKWRWRGVAALLILVGLGLMARSPSTQQARSISATAPPVTQSESQPATMKSRWIGRSYDQIASFPPEVFVNIESSPLRDGRPRMLLTTNNNLATLEVIGQKDRPEEASLSLFMPNDNALIVTKHALLVMAFLDNVAPEWGERRSWATDALRRAVDSPGAEEQVTQGGTTISIRFLQPLSMVQIFVSPSP